MQPEDIHPSIGPLRGACSLQSGSAGALRNVSLSTSSVAFGDTFPSRGRLRLKAMSCVLQRKHLRRSGRNFENTPSNELGPSQRAETYSPKGLMFPKASKVGDGYSIIPSDAGSFRGEFRPKVFFSAAD